MQRAVELNLQPPTRRQAREEGLTRRRIRSVCVGFAFEAMHDERDVQRRPQLRI